MAPLKRPRLLPGVFITDEGRRACWDGGVEGGSLEELEICATLMAGEREGELARYKSRSAPDCFDEVWSRRVGGGVRGGEDEMILLEGSCANEFKSSSSE